ncbi:phosphotransferase enzyme family protein [Biscogniauxia marginata]|nr:phosphotransferase enzyme family protein [Biscogniauxia marginata]
MTPPIKAERVASIMLSWQSLELISCRNLQSLWAGYGHICEVTARATTAEAAARVRDLCGDSRPADADTDTDPDTFALVLKLISPPPTTRRPGSEDDDEDEGHLRKMLSYEVERYFYSAVAPRLGVSAPVARCLATTRDVGGRPGAELLGGLTATLMTDLRPRYPVAGGRRSELSATQVRAALDWLASFHRASRRLLPMPAHELVLPPLEEAARRRDGGAAGTGLWRNGGYTYLATRRRELAALADDADSEWCAALCEPPGPGGATVAEAVAEVLTPRDGEHESLIHGDVKSENLFTNWAGDEVAFFDFQYVGLGLGVCDLAKLFTCSMPLSMLTDYDDDNGGVMPDELLMDEGEKRLLERYRATLLAEGKREYDWATFVRHWETALVDWLRFQASWGFWGNTEWLEARVRSILKDGTWRSWLYEQHVSGAYDGVRLRN